MEKVQKKKESKKETATVDKREETTVNKQDAKKIAEIDALIESKKQCIKEIGEILEKHSCELKAQLTINDERTVSQVFIINK